MRDEGTIPLAQDTDKPSQHLRAVPQDAGDDVHPPRRRLDRVTAPRAADGIATRSLARLWAPPKTAGTHRQRRSPTPVG
jgi:hypothetical protein